jgi:hypothetical protein
VPSAECSREAGTPIVIAGGVDVRDPALRRESSDSVANQSAPLSRAVIGNIAGDHD